MCLRKDSTGIIDQVEARTVWQHVVGKQKSASLQLLKSMFSRANVRLSPDIKPHRAQQSLDCLEPLGLLTETLEGLAGFATTRVR